MNDRDIRVFLCGDVMTGRGIDQILAHPSDPGIHEPWVRDAGDYVRLAEETNGPIPRGVTGGYLWERILGEWQKREPLVKIINLETAITQSSHHWAGKWINYRMHPGNIDALTSARVDVCALANNHILDWGEEGLVETLNTLAAADIGHAGAGRDLRRAMAPAVMSLPGDRRLLLFAAAASSSGVPSAWAAGADSPGLWLLEALNDETFEQVRAHIAGHRRPGDLVVLSIHWGGNWGYDVPRAHRDFARRLCDEAVVSVIHGHSSHHPMPVEIFRHKPILYGCGDFINDYEGVSGHEEYRGDLSLMYFLAFDAGDLAFKKMEVVPLQIKHFRLQHAPAPDLEWILETLNTRATFEDTHFYQADVHTLVLNSGQRGSHDGV